MRKIRGMNWMARISLVLIFTLVFSTFMYQGWYKPKKAEAATVTYYVNAITPGVNVGVDGTTTMTTLADITVTTATTNVNRGMTNTTVPAGTTRWRLRKGAADTATKDEFFRAYTPAYATATTIAANAGVYADFYMNTTGTGVTAIADIYEYNGTTGFVGAAKGTASFVGNATIATRQTMNTTFNNAAFTVATGNRVVVIFYFTTNASRPAYLWGQSASATPSGYQSFTLTESTCAAVTPTGLAAGTMTPTSVPLTWTTNVNNNYYRVYRNGVKISTDGAVTTGSYTDSTVTPDTVYNATGYTVTGYNTAGACESAASTAVAVTTPSVTPVAPTVANPQLTTLDVTINTETPANPTTTTYAIGITGGAFTNQYISATGTVVGAAVWQSKAAWGTKTVSGLANGTTYTFDVMARNQALVTTPFGPTAQGTTTSPCPANQVTGLAAGTATTTTIPLTWTSPTTNVDYYNVYRNSVKISTDGAVTTGSFTDSGPLTPSTTYSYYVKGYNSAGTCEGTASLTVNKSTLAATPVAPVVSNTGTGTSANVTIGSDTNSAEATYAIRINGSQYISATGTVVGAPVWQSKLAWATITVTGLTVNTTYTFDVEARNGNGELVVTAFGPTAAVTVHVSLPSTISSCAGCHGYTASFTDGTARNNPAGTFVGSHNKHVVKIGAVCSVCHVVPATETSADFGHRTGSIQMKTGATGISGGFYDKANTGVFTSPGDETFSQTNSGTTRSCRNISCHGGNNPTPQWGVGTARCIDCHSGIVSAMNASAVSGGTVTQRDQIAGVGGEFGLAWGHKNSTRGAVADADCIVCHLEGKYTAGVGSAVVTSAYHADGYIDLRDPDGAGETEITDMGGTTPFRFVKFSTLYTAGSRTSTGNTSNNIDNVLTQKFCLPCHDNNGATNPTARSNNGGTGTANMPFGGINLGANYTVANGAVAAGGLIDVKTELSTSNRSWHPVLGPKNRDFPTAARMNNPYKATGTRGTSGTLSQGVVLNCFDCHNVTGSGTDNTTGLLTTRTIVAHGNAVTIRGVAAVSGTPAAGNDVTFCKQCHAGYVTGGSSHGAGSALSGNTNGGMTAYLNYGCNICHSSGMLNPGGGTVVGTAAVPRPIRAQDTHGSNTLGTVGTLLATVGRWSTDPTPVAFIRDRQVLGRHAPLAMAAQGSNPAWAGGTQCMGGNLNPCSRGNQTYTVGGTY